MIEIYDYMLRPQTERQQHLDLSTPCDERGGMSSYFKGLLAHFVGTSIPSGHVAHVAHACHNSKCSNVRHLYWGTPAENRADAVANGAPTFWEAKVAKYGYEQACAMSKMSFEHASKAGKASAKIPRNPERYRKTAVTLTGTRMATNGIVNRRLKEGEPLPAGFKWGMTRRKG